MTVSLPGRGAARRGGTPPSPAPSGPPPEPERRGSSRRRRLGLVLIAAGLAALAWSLAVWQWRDPFTSLYTTFQQQRLADRYEALAADVGAVPLDPEALGELARRYRARVGQGDPIGRLEIPRLDLELVLVNGTDSETLKKGPGRDERSFMPGEGELVYVAGHRTTYLAPFGDIDRLRPGDAIHVEVPYGLFTYEVTRREIVDDSDLSVLRSPGREALRLQACHPRFFATQRYVVFAKPVGAATQAATTR